MESRSTTTPSSSRARTGEMVMVSRVILTSNGSSVPSRWIVTVMSEPTGPRIMSTASSRVSPITLSPSTWMMTSPGCTPARSAGVPSIGVTTLTKPFSWVTSMPRPPNSPLVCTRMSSKSSGGR